MKLLTGKPTRAAARALPTPALSPQDLATAWQAISLLLDYPDQALLDQCEVMRAECAQLPGQVGVHLLTFLDSLPQQHLAQWQREYVETFDHTRKCCLYLTYFTHGDTRGRGLALVQLKQAYRKAGVEFAADELPDHLCVVLEFGAAYDAQHAWELLATHRAGVEVLRQALGQRASRWSPVVEALSATLPALDGDQAQVLQRLIAQGPPNEEVGLEMTGYAMNPHLSAWEPGAAAGAVTPPAGQPLPHPSFPHESLGAGGLA